MPHAWFSQRKQPIIYTVKNPPLLSNKNRSRVFLNQYSWLFARINKPEWKGNSSRSNWTHTTRQKKKRTAGQANLHAWPCTEPYGGSKTEYGSSVPYQIQQTTPQYHHIPLCFPMVDVQDLGTWLNPGPSNNSRTWDTPLAHQTETKADQTPCPCLSLENY